MDDRFMPISRRRTLALLAAGAGLLAWPASARPACVVTPAQTEGPFFIDTGLNRSDIRSETGGKTSAGLPLALSLRVSAVNAGGSCTPLPDALVEVWHCDATGAYSGTAGTAGKNFLRGHQATGSGGEARFLTVYPGWYPGRAIHIHFKVLARNAAGRRVEFTSQLYFDDKVNDSVMSQPPYAARGSRRVRNEDDFLYRNGGRQLTTTPSVRDGGHAAAFDIGMRL